MKTNRKNRENLIAFLLIILFLFGCVQSVSARPLDNINSGLKQTGEIIVQTGGVITGFTFGSLIGMVRGYSKGAIVGTDFASELLGNKEGSVERSVGFLSGGFLAGFTGGAYGLLMGAYDGITYGVSDPFSKENLSLTGDYFTDYELLD
ncbi:MAG: hypothetical protein HYR97_09065 [Candidatus Melainabacteria bacterium]|nr:hypothetical protein [Candidatus Melainabacteria bacterium]MBI3308304.1 hypothetical protein [Candidatus Melainabacteria bacterium]